MNFVLWLVILNLFQFLNAQSESRKIKIKSLIIPSGVTKNEEKNIYDGIEGTRGTFIGTREEFYPFKFDIGENQVINQIKVIVSDKLINMKIFVGNSMNEKRMSEFQCESNKNILICTPKCNATGIYGRNILMNIFLGTSWTMIYEVEVYVSNKKLPGLDDITKYRSVFPQDCSQKNWQITETGLATKPFNKGIIINLEMSYIITEVTVKVKSAESSPINFDLKTEKDEVSKLSIDLKSPKCTVLDKLKYKCKVDKKRAATRIIEITSDGIIEFSAMGKPVFFPTLFVIPDKTNSDNLKIICEVKKCDLKTSQNCSEAYLNTGVHFGCINKRLIRMPTADDSKDSLVIIDYGKVKDTWNSTNFKVVTSNVNRIIVSIPRSYQYFGKYKCSCLASDEQNTEISSPDILFDRDDFIKDLGFNIKILYGVGDSQPPTNQVNNNLLMRTNKQLEDTSYLNMKYELNSLLNDLNLKLRYPIDKEHYDTMESSEKTAVMIKAFPKIKDSWKVNAYKYEVIDVFPEFVPEKEITLNITSKSFSNRFQTNIVSFLTPSKSSKPTVNDQSDEEYIKLDFIYVSTVQIALSMKEISCSGMITTKLATFTGTECKSQNSDVKCLKQGNTMLVKLQKKRGLSSDYEIMSNNTILKKIPKINVLRGKEVDQALKYTKLEKLTQKSSVKVSVEVTIQSKIISDYILCGKVVGMITVPDKEKQKLVLQSEKLVFDVVIDETKPSTTVNIQINIDNVKGNYTESLTIINPIKLKVDGLRYTEDIRPFVSWTGIQLDTYDLLDFYNVSVNKQFIVCKDQNQINLSYKTTKYRSNQYEKRLNSNKKTNSYLITVNVVPVFKGGIVGESAMVENTYKVNGTTSMKISQDVYPNERDVTIIPFQKGIPCNIQKVEFKLKSNQVINVSKDIKLIENMKNIYKIAKLVPGRSYHLIAQVVYLNGDKDEESEYSIFETADKISVDETKKIAKVGEKIKIKCKGDIGPSDKYKKTISWKRFNGADLPLGLRSEILSSQPNTAYLVTDKALQDYNGDYACFISPAIGIGSKSRVTLVINDLSIDMTEKELNFKNTMQLPFTVSCSTLNEDTQMEMTWIDPNGQVIPKGDSTDYFVDMVTDKSTGTKLNLKFKNPHIGVTGEYKCSQKSSGQKSSTSFYLYGTENIEITTLPNHSELLGEKSNFLCKGTPGMKGQIVEWVTNNHNDIMKAQYALVPNKLMQELEVKNVFKVKEVTCKLTPPMRPGGEEYKKSQKIKMMRKIVVKEPMSGTKLKEGVSVNMKCTAYIDKPGLRVQWVFYPNDKKDVKIVKVNRGQEDLSKPITLDLKLDNLKQNETGEYSCEFELNKKEKSLTDNSQSIQLSIEPVTVEIKEVKGSGEKPKKSAFKFNSQSYISFLLPISFILSQIIAYLI